MALLHNLHNLLRSKTESIESPLKSEIGPPVNLPPRFDKGNGISTAESNIPNVYRDGGGGGKVNGHNIIMFSDTTTTKGGQEGQMIGFTCNSIAYMDPKDPSKLIDFGDGVRPRPGIAFLREEEQWTTANWESKGERQVIWPESNLTAIDSTTGIFFAPTAVFTKNITGYDLYNSLMTIKAYDSGPIVERIVPRMFSEQNGEVNWGKFGSLRNPHNNMLNVFGKDKTGIKVAQVSLADLEDRSKWTFWNGSSFTSTPPARDRERGNIITDGIAAGDLFWSPYFRTFLCVYFNTFPGTFRLRYSLDGRVEGKWSNAIELFDTKAGTKVPYNFAGHAYPGYDESGKTLLLTWTYDGNWTRMTRITFE